MSSQLEYAKDLREKRAAIAEKMHALSAKAQEETRNFTDEEVTEFDRMAAECDELEATFLRIERAEKDKAVSDAREERKEQSEWVDKQLRDAGVATIADHGMAFRGWLLQGRSQQTPEMREAMTACGMDLHCKELDMRMPALPFSGRPLPKNKAEIRQAIQQACSRAQDVVTTRATTAQTITTTGGGNLVGNDNSLIGMVWSSLMTGGAIRSVATIYQTETGATLPIPLDDNRDKGTLVAINTAVDTANLSFGQTTLDAKKYGSLVKLPVELIRDSAIDIEQFTGVRIGERLQRITEEHFATGEASGGEPEGMVTTGSSGGSAAGTTQSSEANVTVADLKSHIGKIDNAYLNGASWMMHQSVRTNIAGQLDGDGRPLWQPALERGEGDMLLGYPVVINNEYGAFTGTSANPAKLLTFGRHDHYAIRDVMGVQVQQLGERFAELAQVGVIGFSHHDGQYINTAVTNTTNASVKHMVSAAS